jgi:hypothetical protein
VPVCVLATSRPVEVEHLLLAELLADPSTAMLRPSALTAASVDALVQQELGADAADAFSSACHQATGGNPLLLRELLRTLAAEDVAPVAASVAVVERVAPDAVTRSVRLRLGRLPPEAVRLARGVAVLGDRIEREPAAALAELDRQQIAPAAAALAVVLLLLALPWLAAELGFHLDGVPVLGWIFLTGKVVGVRAAVHLGHHHGMDGVLLTLAALLLVPLVRRIRARGLRLLVGLYLGLQIAYGLANAAQDGWLEQVAKRGWTTHVIPSVLHPALTLPWLGIAVAAAVFAALILRPAPARRSGRPGPRTPASLRARPGAARDG